MNDLEKNNLIDIYRRNILVFQMLYEFNYLPGGYIHPSRRSEFFHPVMSDEIWQNQRLWPRLSDAITKKLNIENDIYFAYPDQSWAFCLLSNEKIHRIASYIGAIVVGSRIRSSLARDEVLDWKERLGSDVYEFVMNQARLIKGYSFKSEFKEFRNIEALGYSVLLSCVNDLPDAVKKRLQLKFHAGAEFSDFDKKTSLDILHSVMLILEREWYLLFDPKKN